MMEFAFLVVNPKERDAALSILTKFKMRQRYFLWTHANGYGKYN